MLAATAGITGAAVANGLPRPARRRAHGTDPVERLACLYNGYLLTVDPAKALAADSTADRYRLYVLHAVLIQPETGRIAAVFPALGTPAVTGGPVAHPASDYAALRTSETPPAPGLTKAQLVAYWRQAGVDEALLDASDWVDLAGAVATPGLTDAHFHVTSWSKKVPAPGQRFGFWGDLSDPAYYVDPADFSRRCPRDAMWRIVADANRHLIDTGDDGIFLHGYIYAEIDNDAQGQFQAAFMYSPSAALEPGTPNPAYLPNRIGPHAVSVPADPCASDPAGWPPLESEMLPALIVHTSGQSCWYNPALLDGYNAQQDAIAATSPPLPLTTASPSGTASGDTWILGVPTDAPEADVLFTRAAPYNIDVEVSGAGTGGTLLVPFEVLATDVEQRTLTAQAMIPELASTALAGTPASLQARPFHRPIAAAVPKAKWDAALAYWGDSPTDDTIGYGAWDPRDPYATNWYNGAKRGLIQYFFDASAQAWRPTGYAEHYPMRDLLGSVVITSPTSAQLMDQRRFTAAWCHRHGLTLVNDIMVYRRRYSVVEAEAYEALSYDHSAPRDLEFFSRTGLDPTARTGNLYLRTGLYYYVESGDDVDDSLLLAHDAANGSDLDRLKPPPGHPEYPGWVRWLGWKLQLDGALATRNGFTNAPLAKISRTDPLPVTNEIGATVTFNDHSFGLLTMTDLQEQVLTSRETAALYWLVRESDPTSRFYNPEISRNWSVLARGVVNFLGAPVDANVLAADLRRMTHVTLNASQADQLADKLVAVVEQVNDAWERTLAAVIRIWYERSRSPASLPPMPSQTVCHVSGDGAVDLWARVIGQLKADVENLPATWSELPPRWQAVVPEDADLTAIRRTFDGERFRMEHLVFISKHVLEEVAGTNGIDAATAPASRNVAVTLQPAIFLLDAGTGSSFPTAQELWPMPNDGTVWGGLPAVPRSHLADALPTFLARDIPFTINTDPPSMRDPRPALTVLGAVARTPIEIDPSHWADQTGTEPPARPPDYLAGRLYPPLGLVEGASTNPMQLTVEQALAAMTFWGAYSACMDSEAGALAVPTDPGQPGWFADLVVWRANPLAITGPGGLTVEALGRTPGGENDAARLATLNAFISKFLPKTTVVAGVTVYEAS